jgi:preprotein translocase subunit SecY
VVLPLLVLKEQQESGQEKIELIQRKLTVLIWVSQQVAIISRIQVNLMEVFIMGMEHLGIIIIIILQKWAISLMELRIQIIMDLLLYLSSNQNLH